MQLLNSAGLLAVLTFGSVVSSLPSAVTVGTTVFDPNVTFDEHIKKFNGPFKVPSSFDKDSLIPLAPLKPSKALDKRYVTSTCGADFHLEERVQEAAWLCDAAIAAIENPTDIQRDRYIRYFSAGYWNPTVRTILRDRYVRIREKFYELSLIMVCLRWEYNNNAYATTEFIVGRPDLDATIRLYLPFWEAPDPNQCGDNASKREILVHEGAHAAFQADDHGLDPAMDAYLIGWYATAEYGGCPV